MMQEKQVAKESVVINRPPFSQFQLHNLKIKRLRTQCPCPLVRLCCSNVTIFAEHSNYFGEGTVFIANQNDAQTK